MSGSVWIASYVLLWAAVVGLSVLVVALLRQVGVLHARLQPLGVHPAGEGPEEGEPAPPLPAIDYAASSATLITFTSPTCAVCEQLAPSLRALESQYRDLRLVEIAMDAETSPVFRAFSVRSTPYLVAVDRGGVVRGKGVANSLEQAELLVEEALTNA